MTIEIGGTAYTDSVSVEVNKSTSTNNSSSSFTATFENTAGYHKDDFNINDSVVIKADIDDTTPNTTVFNGLVEDIKFEGQGSTKEIIVLTGRDLTARLQDIKIEPEVFNNTETSEIVTDIMDVISDITTTNVDVTETVIEHISFNHLSIFDALKQLADLSGRYFFVDVNNDLNFKQKNNIVSGYIFDNTNVTKSQFRQLDREIANNVWVYGDKILVGVRNSFTADGGSVYDLDYRPHNTNVYVAGSTTPKQGGIFNLVTGDVGSPTQYLVDFDGARAIFVSGTQAGDNIPTSGVDSINIDYERKRQIVKFGIDRVSETSYGRKDKVIVDKNIIDPSAASDRVKQELNDNGSPIIQGTLNVSNIVNIIPGQIVNINLPNSNQININYDVIEVTYKFNTKNNLSNNVVSIKVNRRILEFTDTVKQLILDVKKLQGEETFDSEGLTRLEFATGSFGFRIAEWNVKTRNVGDSFVLGHPVNGKLGSPVVGISGGQVILGSSTAGAFTKVRSGTYLDI